MNIETWTCATCSAACRRVKARGTKPKYCDAKCAAKAATMRRKCRHCGGPGVSSESHYCSADCRRMDTPGWTWPQSTVPKDHASRAVYPSGPSRRVFYPDCCVCSRVFATPYTATTCSPRCTLLKRREAKGEAKHRRRARQRASLVESVSRRKVYERDRWRCYLCNAKVRADSVVPDPLAPTLDHVVPLALGGEHSMANVRLACYRCNCIKGARGGGEQLALIG